MKKVLTMCAILIFSSIILTGCATTKQLPDNSKIEDSVTNTSIPPVETKKQCNIKCEHLITSEKISQLTGMKKTDGGTWDNAEEGCVYSPKAIFYIVCNPKSEDGFKEFAYGIIDSNVQSTKALSSDNLIFEEKENEIGRTSYSSYIGANEAMGSAIILYIDPETGYFVSVQLRDFSKSKEEIKSTTKLIAKEIENNLK